ncbi:substrate-binding domain-containing protein [Chitinophaga sp. SYP-B3965]|uniref:LacI family DNA-binding transcriptional regulator n=1 Tax=Chitinophaga sp. SYP-B3965 TaxID=2663120 RepID=UPI001299AA44|nr:substrate-binding domain-containing protein [Chitinophaga sp. SYP-B3965]MRG45002.1 substrate-binding domain-containing protein [Chitinophaga sp. SYP-B3965]
MKKKVSLKDIAQEAGVSTALVSYVLTNKEEKARVGQEMAKKIRKIARKLNYQPNHIARSLKSGRSDTIGLIVADISNPFFANIARTIEDEAKRNNYTVIFGSSDENVDKSRDLINVLLNRQVDGLILIPTEGSEQQIKTLQNQNVPFVLIDRYFPDIPASHISINNYESAYNAVSHLIKMGRQQIGMIAYKTALHHISERKRGYMEALTDQKKSLMKLARYSHLKEDIKLAIDQLLNARKPADALFFATNSLAIEGLKYINELGIRVPEDLAVVSFDESEAFDLFYSPVTYVRQPILEMGKEAVRVLLEQIKDADKPAELICIDTELVIRKSSGKK